MKKPQKKNASLFDQKVTLTYDERLDNIPLEDFARKKLEEANEHLRKMKLPDEYYNR